MPQSLANVTTHMVFSTKNRSPMLQPDVKKRVLPYLAATLNNHGCPCLAVGGVEDHVHLLFQLGRTIALAQVAEKVKTGSSKAVGPGLTWQSGYGAFAISSGDVEAARHYVLTQEEHHRKVSFQDEYRELLRAAGIEWNEGYVWD